MKLCSLFSGIGMLDIGVESGLRDEVTFVQSCEINPYARFVLYQSYLRPAQWGDVRDYHPQVEFDVLTAGSPCQDFSRCNAHPAGLQGEKSSLVHEVPRIAREAGVHTIVLENVCAGRKPILRYMQESLPSWQWGSTIVSAASVGLPHRRRRALIMGSRKYDIHPNPDPLPELAEPLIVTPVATEAKGGERRIAGMPRFAPEKVERFKRRYGSIYPPMYREGPRGGIQVTPEFCEALMGIPSGWVTEHKNIPYAEQLRLIGNSCVPYAIHHGVRNLLNTTRG